ncbi:hypothetical protein CRV11_01210 [Candidatus Pantoea edessiphila]|uniref:Porin n=1 Tax=Candidatus Pantoea edessiphila TaxID=2044610 RepID=A0A2P5SZ07_9GAMM|nr:porin [Candidatus Pantoea edessiphila]PPI87532.1 hypothetical protein CRV11_01210 [Candidatus Pantoea edessiphila]
MVRQKKIFMAAVTMLTVLISNVTNAVEVYNKNNTKLDIYGEIDGFHYLYPNASLNKNIPFDYRQNYFIFNVPRENNTGLDKSRANFGFKAETLLDDNIIGYGQLQYDSPLYMPESTTNSTSRATLGFVGIKSPLGSIDYGRNYGVIHDVSSWTSVLPEFGGNSEYSDNFLAGRNSGLFTYRNKDFFGIKKNLNFAIQYQSQRAPSIDVMHFNGNTLGASISYVSSSGLGIAAAYGNSMLIKDHSTTPEPKNKPKNEPKNEPKIDQNNGPKIDQNNGPKIDQNNGPKIDQNNGPKIDQNNGPKIDQNNGPKIDQNNGPKIDQNNGPKIDQNNGPKIDQNNHLNDDLNDVPKIDQNFDHNNHLDNDINNDLTNDLKGDSNKVAVVNKKKDDAKSNLDPKDNARQWSAAIKYEKDHIYFATMYGETLSTTYLEKAGKDYVSGFADKIRNFEIVGKYKFDFGFSPSIAYIVSKVQNMQGGNTYLYRYLDIGATYNLSKNMSTYIDYRIDQKESKGLLNFNDPDNILAIGLVYKF